MQMRKWICTGATASLIILLSLTISGCSSFPKEADPLSKNQGWTQVQNAIDFDSLYQEKLPALKAAHEVLSGVDTYVECSYQFLEIRDSWFAQQFIYAYEIMHEEDRMQYEDMSKPGTIYPVLTAQVSSNCFDFFQLPVQAGRTLSPEDMDYREGNMIPVLVGSNYSEFLEIGDTFSGSYILKDLDFIVVGILSSQSNIGIDIGRAYLDNYIVMPSFNCLDQPSSERENMFQVRHYVNKLSGMYRETAADAINNAFDEINSLEIGVFS